MLSKRDGGRWLLEHRPDLAGLVTAALDEYADPCGRQARAEDLRRLALSAQGFRARPQNW